ncbi:MULTISPECIES: small membrane protein [Klebsiella]
MLVAAIFLLVIACYFLCSYIRDKRNQQYLFRKKK